MANAEKLMVTWVSQRVHAGCRPWFMRKALTAKTSSELLGERAMVSRGRHRPAPCEWHRPTRTTDDDEGRAERKGRLEPSSLGRGIKGRGQGEEEGGGRGGMRSTLSGTLGEEVSSLIELPVDGKP